MNKQLKNIFRLLVISLISALAAILLISCEKTHYRISRVYGKVITKDFEPEYTKWEYHYGYSGWRGKFCWHWGNNTHSAKYTIIFSVENKKIYGNYNDFQEYNLDQNVPFNKIITIRDKDSVAIDTSCTVVSNDNR